MAHDVRVKAAAIAAMLTGNGVRQTARRYGVPRSTVSRWRQTEVLPRLRGLNIRLSRFHFRRVARKRDTKKAARNDNTNG